MTEPEPPAAPSPPAPAPEPERSPWARGAFIPTQHARPAPIADPVPALFDDAVRSIADLLPLVFVQLVLRVITLAASLALVLVLLLPYARTFLSPGEFESDYQWLLVWYDLLDPRLLPGVTGALCAGVFVLWWLSAIVDGVTVMATVARLDDRALTLGEALLAAAPRIAEWLLAGLLTTALYFVVAGGAVFLPLSVAGRLAENNAAPDTRVLTLLVTAVIGVYFTVFVVLVGNIFLRLGYFAAMLDGVDLLEGTLRAVASLLREASTVLRVWLRFVLAALLVGLLAALAASLLEDIPDGSAYAWVRFSAHGMHWVWQAALFSIFEVFVIALWTEFYRRARVRKSAAEGS